MIDALEDLLVQDCRGGVAPRRPECLEKAFTGIFEEIEDMFKARISSVAESELRFR